MLLNKEKLKEKLKTSTCIVCGRRFSYTDELDNNFEYCKTKRKTEIFFHKTCVGGKEC